MNHYVYYSYEEWGRGYIGSRSCECDPEEDLDYFGSYEDKTFKPTQKIILYAGGSREDVNTVEGLLHDFFEVDINPEFANLSRQRSSGFYRSGPHTEETIEKMKRNRKGKGLGPSPHTREHLRGIGRKGGILGAKNQTREDKKKGGDKCKKDKLGMFALTEEENKIKSQRGASTTNSQAWKCLVTGKESTAAGLARWQRARGIDTRLRKRVYPELKGV
jgi:hypothetical protein